MVNVGSTSGIFSPALERAYGVPKAALHALTVATATELQGRVAVNALSPGRVRTDMAPDGPGDPRWSAESAVSIIARPRSVTGKLIHDSRQRGWVGRFPR